MDKPSRFNYIAKPFTWGKLFIAINSNVIPEQPLDIDFSIIVALISVVGTIIVAAMNLGKMNKTDAVKLEHRLTVVEQHQFTREDRERLTRVDTRIESLMSVLGGVLPKNLKNPIHLDGILDTLSDKATSMGWSAVIDFVRTEMPIEDRAELLTYLQVQSKSRSKQRRLWAGLYLGMLKLELEPPMDGIEVEPSNVEL